MTGREKTPEDDEQRRNMNESSSRNRHRRPSPPEPIPTRGNSSTNNSPLSPSVFSNRETESPSVAGRAMAMSNALERIRRSLDPDSERSNSRESGNVVHRRKSSNPAVGSGRSAGSGGSGSTTAQTGWETPPLDSLSSGSRHSSPYVTAAESKTSTCPSPTLSDVEVVGFVKAMADRTPVEVTLSSDEADSGDPDIIMERRKKRHCKEEGGKISDGGKNVEGEEEEERLELAKRRKERRRRRREERRKAAEIAGENDIDEDEVVDVEKEDRARDLTRSKSSSKSASLSQRLLKLTRQHYDRRGNLANDDSVDDASTNGVDTPTNGVDAPTNYVETPFLFNDDEDSDIAEALRVSRAMHDTVVIGDSDYEVDDDDDDVIIEGVRHTSPKEPRRRRRRRNIPRIRLGENSNDEEEEEEENSSSSRSSTQASATAASSVLKAKVWDFLESARREREIADRARVAGKENRGWDAEEEEEEEEMARRRNKSPSSRGDGREGGGGENDEIRDKSPRRKKGSGSGKGKGKGKGKSSKKSEAVAAGEGTSESGRDGISGASEVTSSDAQSSKDAEREAVTDGNVTAGETTIGSQSSESSSPSTDESALLSVAESCVEGKTVNGDHGDNARCVDGRGDDGKNLVKNKIEEDKSSHVLHSSLSSVSPLKLKSVVARSSISKSDVAGKGVETMDNEEDEEETSRVGSDDERAKKGELRSVVERPRNNSDGKSKARHKSESSSSSSKSKKSKKLKRKREIEKDFKKIRGEDCKMKRFKS